MVLAEQLDTCDKICVIRYLGRVSKGQMRGIDEAVRIQLGYYIPEQVEEKKTGQMTERMAKKAMDKLITRKEAASILGIRRKNTGCCKNRRFDLLCSVCGKRLRLFHGSGDSGVHCKMYAPCKTDGTCCDISQTSKLSAVKIDIVEYRR